MQSKPVKIANPSEHHSSMVEQLIATNVTLQNKMVDLLIGTKELNENVNKLVHLFTDAAAHIRTGKYEDPLIEKLNDLLEQNKLQLRNSDILQMSSNHDNQVRIR